MDIDLTPWVCDCEVANVEFALRKAGALPFRAKTNGVWRAKSAEPYPLSFCRRFGHSFDNGRLALTAQEFGHHLL